MVSIPDNTQRLVCALAGPHCPVSGCDGLLFQDLDDGKRRFTGQIAHIRSKALGGPRHDPDYPSEMLDSYENLLVLCPTHHDQADHDADKWTIAALTELREGQEEAATQRSFATRWDAHFHAVHYLNIPRLAWLAAVCGVAFPDDLDVSDLPPGLAMVPFMVSAEELLRRLHPLATDLDSGARAQDLQPGSLVAFDRPVRTKNPRLGDRSIREWKMTGDWRKDPHVYLDVEEIRAVLPIDPRYITSNTAEAFLRAGMTTLAGLAQVKAATDEETTLATPLVLGLAGRGIDELLR